MTAVARVPGLRHDASPSVVLEALCPEDSRTVRHLLDELAMDGRPVLYAIDVIRCMNACAFASDPDRRRSGEDARALLSTAGFMPRGDLDVLLERCRRALDSGTPTLRAWAAVRARTVGLFTLALELELLADLEHVEAATFAAPRGSLVRRWIATRVRDVAACNCPPVTRDSDGDCRACGATRLRNGSRKSPDIEGQHDLSVVANSYLDARPALMRGDEPPDRPTGDRAPKHRAGKPTASASLLIYRPTEVERLHDLLEARWRDDPPGAAVAGLAIETMLECTRMCDTRLSSSAIDGPDREGAVSIVIPGARRPVPVSPWLGSAILASRRSRGTGILDDANVWMLRRTCKRICRELVGFELTPARLAHTQQALTARATDPGKGSGALVRVGIPWRRALQRATQTCTEVMPPERGRGPRSEP